MGSSEGQSVPSLSLSFWCNPATFGVPSFEVYLSNLYRPHHAAFVPLCASTFPSFYEDSSNGIGLIQYELFKNSITSAKTLFPDKITFTRGLGLKTSEAHLLGKHDSIYNILIPQYLNYRISKSGSQPEEERTSPKDGLSHNMWGYVPSLGDRVSVFSSVEVTLIREKHHFLMSFPGSYIQLKEV